MKRGTLILHATRKMRAFYQAYARATQRHNALYRTDVLCGIILVATLTLFLLKVILFPFICRRVFFVFLEVPCILLSVVFVFARGFRRLGFRKRWFSNGGIGVTQDSLVVMDDKDDWEAYKRVFFLPFPFRDGLFLFWPMYFRGKEKGEGVGGVTLLFATESRGSAGVREDCLAANLVDRRGFVTVYKVSMSKGVDPVERKLLRNFLYLADILC